MIDTLVSAFVGVGLFIGSLFGILPAPVPAPAAEQTLGAALPSGTAVFETSLQSRITSTDTSMTLVTNSVRGGSSLSGFQCFTVDEGRTDAEYICGTVSGTSVSSMTRGVDPSTGTTSNSALKFAHRVGANVKITDFPVLQILRNQANGSDTYDNILRYTSKAAAAFTNSNDIINKAYVDSLAFGAVPAASEAAAGFVELASGCEAASSTLSGSASRLAVPANLATSTWNSAVLAACKVLVASNDGKLDRNFLDSSIVSTSSLARFATSSVNVGAFPAYQIGKNVQVFTSTGTSTFSVPQGITKVCSRVQAAGGGGGAASDNTSGGGGAGGGGGYSEECVDVTGTSTIQIFVGTGGVGGVGAGTNGGAGGWSTFGTNGFYLSANGGLGGDGNNAAGAQGGCGGGGDINICGGAGGTGAGLSPASGPGGSSHLGGGGASGKGSQDGQVGQSYGGGGGGASTSNSTDRNGAAGAQGIVIVEW